MLCLDPAHYHNPRPNHGTTQNIGKSEIKIFIDPGHGIDTIGKRSPYSMSGVKPELDFYEWSWSRKIASGVVQYLQALDYNAVLLVPEDKDIPLPERVSRIGTGKNSILVSIHSNAFGSGKTWYPNVYGWSAYTTKGKTKSDTLATYLYKRAAEIWSGPGMKLRKDTSDGDPDMEENFYILLHAPCPAVLTESGFYTCPEEVRYLCSSQGVSDVIGIHVLGIIDYIKSL